MTRRTTARVIPVNRHGEVLLLLGRDPAVPERRYWFTIGGGVDAEESLVMAGVRELQEETGIVVTADDLGEPFHRGTHEFSYDGVDYVADSSFYAVRLDDVTVSLDGLTGPEVGNVFEARWWAPESLPPDQLPNPELPALVRQAVAATRVDGR